MGKFTLINRQEEILAKQQTALVPWMHELLIRYACQIYPRVSTPEQRDNVSAEMQQDRRFAIFCGWSNDPQMIIVDTDDLGLSGQLRMEERPAFSQMIRNIVSGRVRTIIVANVDRFFRRKWNDEAEKFMQICDEYKVKVVVPNAYRTGIDFVYDFSKSAHIDQFRRKCVEAWNYLENHIYGRVLPAKDELGRSGRWIGGSLTMGYIVDRRQKIGNERNPNYLKYTPYEPHAEVDRWLLKRFREIGVAQLMREINRMEYLFPAFEEWVDIELVRRVALDPEYRDGKIIGYKIKSDKALRWHLTNVRLIGYWVHKGELVSTDNHEPIVDFNDFLYAFNRLSDTKLDGSVNEEVAYRRLHYMKRQSSITAFLKEHIVSIHDEAERINIHPLMGRGQKTKGQVILHYGFYPRRRWTDKHTKKYLIRCDDLDRCFFEVFIERLLKAEQYSNFLVMESSELVEQQKKVAEIDVQIKAAENAMKAKKVQLGVLTNPDLIREVNDEYTVLQQDVQRLCEQRNRAVNYKPRSERRRSYKQMMLEVGTLLRAGQLLEIIPPEEMPEFIDAFVKKVVIEPLAPHFYKLHIHWHDDEWETDEVVCYRHVKSTNPWTDEENDILRNSFETATWAELVELLPRRVPYNIMHQGSYVLLLPEPKNFIRYRLPMGVCLEDLKVMQEYGITEEEMNTWNSGRLVKYF